MRLLAQKGSRFAFASIAFFLILAAISFLSEWKLGQGFSPRARLSAHDFESKGVLVARDQLAYLQYSDEILAKHHLVTKFSTLWPPLFPLLISATRLVFGEDNYFLHMKIVSAALWAIALAALLLVTRLPNDTWLRGLLLLAPWSLPTFRDISLGDGVLLTESCCLAILTLALSAFLFGALHKKNIGYVGAVVLLSFASHARPVFDVIALMIFLVILTPFFLKKVRCLYHRRAPNAAHSKALNNRLLALALFCLLNLPWKCVVHQLTGHWSMSYVPYYESVVMFWNPNGFENNPGGNAACQVAPNLCSAIDGARPPVSAEDRWHLAVVTFLRHPLLWTSKKVPFFFRFWFLNHFLPNQADVWNFFEGAIFLLLALLSVWLLSRELRRRKNDTLFEFSLIFAAIFVGNVLVFEFQSALPRYSMPLKLLFLLSPIAIRALSKPRLQTTVAKTE